MDLFQIALAVAGSNVTKAAVKAPPQKILIEPYGGLLFGVPMLDMVLAMALAVFMVAFGFFIFIVRGPPLKLGLLAWRNPTVQMTVQANETARLHAPRHSSGLDIFDKSHELYVHHPDSVFRLGRISMQVAMDHFGETLPIHDVEIIDAHMREGIAGIPIHRLKDTRTLELMLEKQDQLREKHRKKSNDKKEGEPTEDVNYFDPDDEVVSKFRELVERLGSLEHLEPLTLEGKPEKDKVTISNLRLPEPERNRLAELIELFKNKKAAISNITREDAQLIYKCQIRMVRGQTLRLKEVGRYLEGEFDTSSGRKQWTNMVVEAAKRRGDDNGMYKLILVACLGGAILLVGGALAFMMITGAA